MCKVSAGNGRVACLYCATVAANACHIEFVLRDRPRGFHFLQASRAYREARAPSAMLSNSRLMIWLSLLLVKAAINSAAGSRSQNTMGAAQPCCLAWSVTAQRLRCSSRSSRTPSRRPPPLVAWTGRRKTSAAVAWHPSAKALLGEFACGKLQSTTA